jgi:hypothetical protein
MLLPKAISLEDFWLLATRVVEEALEGKKSFIANKFHYAVNSLLGLGEYSKKTREQQEKFTPMFSYAESPHKKHPH